MYSTLNILQMCDVIQPWNNQDIERALDPQKFLQAPL